MVNESAIRFLKYGNRARQTNIYDYDKQVYIVDGLYVRCGHPEAMNCKCYGKDHAGEIAVITEHCR